MEVKCDEGTPVPPCLEVDLTGATVGKGINTSRVIVPPGVTLVEKKRPHKPLGENTYVFSTIAGKKSPKTEDDEV